MKRLNQYLILTNFANECQNDVVLGSFNVSRCNVLHGTGSEAFSVRAMKQENWSKSETVRSGSQRATVEKADTALLSLQQSSEWRLICDHS